jgi:hypothetical protein
LQAKIDSAYSTAKIEYLWGKHKETPISVILAPNLQTPPYGDADLKAVNAGIEEGVEEDVHVEHSQPVDDEADDGMEELTDEVTEEADKKKVALPKDRDKRPEKSDKR